MNIFSPKIVFVCCITSLLATGILFLASCHKSPDKPKIFDKGSRHLGIHITAAETQNYGQAFTQARSTGADCIPFTLQWPAYELNGNYDPQGFLNDLNGFFSTQPVSLSLCISPIAANRRDVPSDLLLTAFDDSNMIQRFNRLLDTIHQHLFNTNIRYLLIGNEVDNYFTLNPSEWPAYTIFCEAVRLHARALWGNQLLVGAETTLGGATGRDQQPIAALNSSMDIICLTYYPLTSDFRMRPVSTVNADFEAALNLYAGRQVLMQEVGYSTSAGCSGSDTAQASFVRNMFNIWDKHADQMPYIAFLWLNDLSDSLTQYVTAYYGLNQTNVAQTFNAYIGSLGLCDTLARPKTGFQALQQEARKRGW